MLTCMPILNATNNTRTILQKFTTKSEDHPLWADGTFNGKWGLREYNILVDALDGNKTGMVTIEIGNVSGYYGKIIGPIYVLKGTFYPHYNHSRTSNITGLYFWRILSGRLGSINVEAEEYDI